MFRSLYNFRVLIFFPSQVRPYVNGALYSLLSHAKIVAEARELSFLQPRLTQAHAVADEETKKQLEYILGQLRGDVGGVSSSSTDSTSMSSAETKTTSTISDDEDDESIVNN